jgi:ATP-dependent Clp protease protease subunit
MFKSIVSALAVVGGLMFYPSSAYSQSAASTITIPVSEYERYKKLEEGDQKKQYWKMSFEQILQKENNNSSRAWGLYDYWVLRNVYLNGNVNDSSTSKIISQISTLSEVDTTPVTLVINSGGGGVFAGITLINAIHNSPVPVNTVCDGMAFSMAAVILASGSHRTANVGCSFMIHEVSAGAPGGQTMEQIKWATTILNVENILINMLAEASGLSYDGVQRAAEYETFYNAEETALLGFVDSVVGKSKTSKVPGSRPFPEELDPLLKMNEDLKRKLTK